MEGKPEFLLHYPNQIHCHYPWLGFHLVIINSIILFSFTQTQNLLLLNTFQGGNVKKKNEKERDCRITQVWICNIVFYLQVLFIKKKKYSNSLLAQFPLF